MGSFYMYVGSREKERAGCARGQFACGDAGKKEADARPEEGEGRRKVGAGCARGQFACEDAGKKEAGARAEGGKGEGRVGAGCARGQFACGDAGKKEAGARPGGRGRAKESRGGRRRMAAEEGATCTSF